MSEVAVAAPSVLETFALKIGQKVFGRTAAFDITLILTMLMQLFENCPLESTEFAEASRRISLFERIALRRHYTRYAGREIEFGDVRKFVQATEEVAKEMGAEKVKEACDEVRANPYPAPPPRSPFDI